MSVLITENTNKKKYNVQLQQPEQKSSQALIQNK